MSKSQEFFFLENVKNVYVFDLMRKWFWTRCRSLQKFDQVFVLLCAFLVFSLTCEQKFISKMCKRCINMFTCVFDCFQSIGIHWTTNLISFLKGKWKKKLVKNETDDKQKLFTRKHKWVTEVLTMTLSSQLQKISIKKVITFITSLRNKYWS